MVRETRHLWVGNLPENIREDRIREHFKRYGRVQSVKLLPRLKEEDGSSGLCATVAFMDIKSASKAHNMEHKLDDRCLSTEYYEPAAIPGGSAAPLYVAPRFPHGPSEDHTAFERSSHFYERREGDAYLRRPASAYHVNDSLRGRARERLYRNGPYTPIIERSQPSHHRTIGGSWSYDTQPTVRYPATAPTPDPYSEERRESQPVVHKKRPKSSRSGSESGSNSGSSRSRSRSRSRSHSSSSSSQSVSSSCSSAGTSSPGTEKSCSPHSSHHGTGRSGRVGGVVLQSAVSAPHINNVSPAVQSEDRRPLAICVRNLPIRSSDTSLKDGLFHEYKKHGKVTWVKVVGQAGDRYGLVCFKKPEDVEKALEESHNKLFFGCKIEVAPYQGYDVDDNEFRPYEAELDEFHPKATRTLFIGNLEKDVTASELRKHFEQFGEIIEIDIKKQGSVSSYAFCQYADIASVVKAIRSMDGEHLGNNRIKLGFGKSMATNCVWVDGIAESVSEKYLNLQFNQYGNISHVTVDRERGHALIYYEQIPYAQDAVREMRGVVMRGRKLQVDFASRECQEAFYEHLEKQGHAVVGGERPWERYDSNSREVQAGRFETTVVVPGTRFPRYENQQRPRTASYSRSTNCNTSAAVVPVAGTSGVQSRATSRTQRTGGQRYEYYEAEYPERRYRNYDEFSQGSGASHDDSYEQELRDYGYCRERGDSSPSPGACESETSLRRSIAVVAARPAKSCSPGDKVPCTEDDPAYKRHSLQSVVVSSDVAVPPPLPPPPGAPSHPPDIRHLQKERVHIQHLLEQLEDCTSSGDDESGISSSTAPKKRIKITSDDCGESAQSVAMCSLGSGGLEMCYENHGDVGTTSILVTTHNHRKSVSEVRRLSDVSGKHCSRRLSTDSTSKHGGGRDVRETSVDRLVSVQPYSPHPVCKRRKTGSSTSENEDRMSCRSGKHSHHHHHHQHQQGEPSTSMTAISGGESVDGSRPGTPLCDERPENLLPPTEPRRIPRERLATEGPLSLPLPRFAAQVLSAPRLSVSVSGPSSSAANKTTPVSSPPAAMASPRPTPSHSHSVHQPSTSPGPAPPPASPPPRPPSLHSSSSSDSELSQPTLEERIRSLDEKYEKWSGSRALSAAGGDALAKLDASASERFRFRHKLLDLDLNELQPSDIVKSVLAKRSVFDEDSKRLENFSDKYEPREFVPFSRSPSSFQSLRVKTECAGREFTCTAPTKLVASSPISATATTPGLAGKLSSFSNPPAPQISNRLMGTPSPLHSPSHTLPKSPFSTGTPTTPTALKSPAGIAPLLPQCGAKMQQTAPKASSSGLPAAAKGLQYPFPSHPPVLPTTTVATTTASSPAVLLSVSSAGVKPSLSVTLSTGTVLSPEVSRACVGSATNSSTYPTEVSRSGLPRSSVTILTTATVTKPTSEITSKGVLKVTPATSIVSSSTVSRVATCVKPSSLTVSTASVSSISGSSGIIKSTAALSSQNLVHNSSPAGRPSFTVASSSHLIPKLSSPSVTVAAISKASVSKSVLGTASSTLTVIQSPLAKSAKSLEQLPKISKDHSSSAMRAEVSQSGNIPSFKSPGYSSSSETTVVSPCNPRVVIVPVCVATCANTVATVVPSSTGTTTVLTMTMASTALSSVTSTICTSTVSASPIDTSKGTMKSRVCITIKKENSHAQASFKEKFGDLSRQTSTIKKESSCVISPFNPSKKDKEQESKNLNSISHKSKTAGNSEDKKEKKDTTVPTCGRRDSEKDNENLEKVKEKVDGAEKDKKREMEVVEKDKRKEIHSLDTEKDKRKETMDTLEKERRKDKENADNLDRRKETEVLEKDKWKESHSEYSDKERWKEREDLQEKEKKKETHSTEKDAEFGTEQDKRTENVEKRNKDRRKERGSNSGSPASIGCKRRMSSQDSVDSTPDDAKRLKLEHRKIMERRDSKDSGRSSSSSSKRSSSERIRSHGNSNINTENKIFAKLLEDKVREDKRPQGREEERKKEVKIQDNTEKYKPKEKQKKKSKIERDNPKESKEQNAKCSKELVNEKEVSPKSAKKKDDSDIEEKDDTKHKHTKTKDKKKQQKEDFDSSEFLDEKGRVAKKEKRNSSEKRKDDTLNKDDHKFTSQKKDSKSHKKDLSNSDSESDGSGDGPKKHSIFDIVDDSPAYISMYDKVKARSTKNMQKQEEERRQEKMREKFNLLKQTRAKREEKKRSTSWDEDSDSDNERSNKLKRAVKPMISSSSEDDGRARYEGEEAKLNKCRPVVRIRKEDICLGKSDSDSDMHNIIVNTSVEAHRTMPAVSEADTMGKVLGASSKKGSRPKLMSDVSEDDNAGTKIKNVGKVSDVCSAESDIDQGYADADEKSTTSKKTSKNAKGMKGSFDIPVDEIRKLATDASKTPAEKHSGIKKAGSKNKYPRVSVDSSDEECNKKFLKTESYSDDKQSGLKKSFIKGRVSKEAVESSDDENLRKATDSVKSDVYSNDKLTTTKKPGGKSKLKISADSSEEEGIKKLTDVPKSDVAEDKQALFRKSLLKTKPSKIFMESSIDNKKFAADANKTEMFEDAEEEKCINNQQKPLQSLSDCEVIGPASPPLLENKQLFLPSSIDDKSEVSRKKSHKKKQKRQKISQTCEDGVSKLSTAETDVVEEKSELSEVKQKAEFDRKKHKRERRKSAHGKTTDSEDSKQLRIHKKKACKPELNVLKTESSIKHEEKMEDIFGPLSDDSESGAVKMSLTHNNGGGSSSRMLDKLAGKWQVSVVYGSDSDSNTSLLGPRMDCFAPSNTIISRPMEKERKRREKKRREKKAREERSAELIEAGRALEATLVGPENYSDQIISKCEKHDEPASKNDPTNNEVDIFRFADGDENIQPATVMLLEKTKEKKKKRKKSKEEKQNRREHHHHHHHEKSSNRLSPERKLSTTSTLEDNKTSSLLSASLPSLEMPVSPLKAAPNSDTSLNVSPSHHDSVIGTLSVSATAKSSDKKKPEKFIPGFGTEIDDIIHETAVKSISEFEAPKPNVETTEKEVVIGKSDQGIAKNESTGEEEKPRAVISQEETEDAVAALLGESFGADFTSSECYVDGNGSPHATSHAGAESVLPTDEEEETRKAIEGLIDMKPDTPQSESDLQIDTDAEGDAELSYSGLRFSDHSPRTPDGDDFSHPPKTPDLPSSYYPQQQGAKPFDSDCLLTKSTLQPEQIASEIPAVQKDVTTSEKLTEPEVKAESEEVEPNIEALPDVNSSTVAVEQNVSKEIKSELPETGEPDTTEVEHDVIVKQEEPILPEIVVTENVKSEKSPSSPDIDFKVKESGQEDPLLPNISNIVKDGVHLSEEDDRDQTGYPEKPVDENEVAASYHLESEMPSTDTPPEISVPPSSPLNKPVICQAVMPSDMLNDREYATESHAALSESVTVMMKEEPEDHDEKQDFSADHCEDMAKTENSPSTLDNTNSSIAKEHSVPQCNLNDQNVTAERLYSSSSKENSDFICVAKEEQGNDTARESDFSESESDIKADNETVANLLASESMTQALNVDENSEQENGSSVIKEPDTHRLKLEGEQDPFASPKNTTRDSVLVQDDFDSLEANKKAEQSSTSDLASAIKANSDFWAAKEVNMESVIKTVDALCSSDEVEAVDAVQNDETGKENKIWFEEYRERSNQDSPSQLKVEPEAKLASTEMGASIEKVQAMKFEDPEKEKEKLAQLSMCDAIKDEVQCEKHEEKAPKAEEEEEEEEEEADEEDEEEAEEEEEEEEEEDDEEDEEEEEDGLETINPTIQREQECSDETELPCPETRTTTSAASSEGKIELSTPTVLVDKDHIVVPEDELHDSNSNPEDVANEPVLPRSTGRGKRGTAQRSKMQTPVASGVTTRRTRLTGVQKSMDNLPVSPVSPRRGSRGMRISGNKGSPQDQTCLPANKKLTTDVYEFRDDSEDEGGNNNADKGRPRLILTIKSPQTAASVETREEFPPTTRKSRRLQERDGSRNTVDDVIEDVVRSAGKVTRSVTAALNTVFASPGLSLRPRRSTRQSIGSHRAAILIPEQPRKSPRSGKRQLQQRRLSETNEELNEKKKTMENEEEEITNKPVDFPDSAKSEMENSSKSPDISNASSPSTNKIMQNAADTFPTLVKEHNGEPTTLIDPVTGLLMPMRESEEGQYIPVTTAPALNPTVVCSASELQNSDTEVMDKPKESVRTAQSSVNSPLSTSEVSPAATTWTTTTIPQHTHVPVISNVSQKAPPTIAAAAAPVIGVVRPGNICKPPISTTLPGAKPVPTTLKAHVLQQTVKSNIPLPAVTSAKIVPPVQTLPTTVSSCIPSTLPQPTSVTKSNVAVQPVMKTIGSLVTTKSRESLLVQPSTSPAGVAINPKAHLLQAVTGNKLQSAPTGQSVVVAAPGVPIVSKIHHLNSPVQQQVAVNMKGPSPAAITPKAHLLQAASINTAPPKGIPNFVPHQKPHAPLMGIGPCKVPSSNPPQPPKAHHSPAQQAILTGSVASPPSHLPSPQQPIGSSSRAAVPKAQVPNMPVSHITQHAKGTIESPKVDVSMGHIVLPDGPQSRGQVLQAGLPVPAYEASLQHAGSGGVVAELLPNPQFVLTQRQSPPPAHQQGDVVQHVSYLRTPSAHDIPQHYISTQLMYQQYMRVQQEALGAPIPYHLTPEAIRSSIVPRHEDKQESESEEARTSPPLELRKPAAESASSVSRGASTAVHSLQSPHDRTTDSPQVATVYVHPGSRMPHYTTQQQPPPPPRYYDPGADPPPAHLRTSRHHHPLPGSEAPATQPRLQVATPPHASQVPPQADSLLMLLQRYPVMWQGLLALKNDQAAVQMHFVFGNPHVARDSLPCNSDGSTPPLRIAQRMRLEQTQVDGVARKMQIDNEHCMLLALPCGRDHMDVLQQSNNLQTGFITYLQQKQAAGIVNIAAPGSQQAAYVVHIFPSCDFANENLARIAPDLLHRVADIAHLLIIIATV